MIYKRFTLAILCLLCGSVAFAQDEPDEDIRPYRENEACPAVPIRQSHETRSTNPEYRQQGWDTVINWKNINTFNGITITCSPYIPVEYFNGTYTVEQIPYNPPDPTFYLNYPGHDTPTKKKLAISNDDDWGPSYINIEYPFYFFGIRKTKFLLGDNGIITFATPSGYNGGGECPYTQTTPLPWPDAVPNTPSCNPALMRDAIYGILEDTYTGSNGAYMHGNQGIYYGVIDEEPCRKIIGSWNQIPVFSDSSKRESFQIVCYEGSNIIEIHVKRRNCCPSTNNHAGLIGIQNATGQPQQPIDEESSVITGSPAAFYPTGYYNANNNFVSFNGGMFTDISIDTIAFRFTPQGSTNMTYNWSRLVENDTVILSEYDINNPSAKSDPRSDTNGYYTPMDEENFNLTTAHISQPGKYYFQLRFKNARGDWYNLIDSISIGIDTVRDLHLVKNAEGGNPHLYDVCAGSIAAMSLKMTDKQDIDTLSWRVYHLPYDGPNDSIPGAGALLRRGNMTILNGEKILPVTLNTANLPSLGTRNKIDTLLIRASVTFTNGGVNNDSILLLLYPNFDTTDVGGICQGEPYTWKPSDTHGHSYEFVYTEAQNPRNTYVGGNSEYPLKSIPGCDSLVRLELAVSDTSHTTDVIDTCDAITWINGIFYDESNYTATDTMPNKYGCDSIVHLAFTLYPVTARIHSSVDYFSFDNLNVELTDISTNGGSRKWIFPDGLEQTTSPAYYSIPVDKDSAIIYLIEYAKYGNCESMDSIILPLNKENFWLPNAFTPDQPQNNLFGSVSMKTLYQEMLIYNRRGELVFRCEGVDCTWDGRDLNGNPCSQGGYVYIIRYTNEFEPNKTKVLKGTVMLLR